jgi:hypothetical protein
MKPGPVTAIGASDRPLPVVDSEAGLAAAFQNSVRSQAAFEQELAQATNAATEAIGEPGPQPQTNYSNDNRLGLLGYIVRTIKAIWIYFFG